MGEDGIKGRAEVYEDKPGVAPLLLQVGQGSMEGCGYGILSGLVSHVCELV